MALCFSFVISNFQVLKAHIDQHATYQPVCQLENILFMAIQVHRILRVAHEAPLGLDLNKKDCLV